MYEPKYQLKFDIHSYWRAGTGRGGGALLDEVVHRDVHGLPCLPGRTVKGLLRRAVYRAEMWGLLEGGNQENASLTPRWFGSMTSQQPEETRLDNEAGALGVSDAVIDKKLSDYLIALEARDSKRFKDHLRGFFHYLHATAIDHETGSAEYKSLRAMEVTIPLTLTAQLYILRQEKSDWDKELAELAKCLPLIRALGTSRSRGLGRVTVTLEKV